MKYTFEVALNCNLCGSNEFIVVGKRLNQSQGFNPGRKMGITTTVVKCRNCGLKIANPMPIPESIGNHYDMALDQYFENHAHAFNENTFKKKLSTSNQITLKREVTGAWI